MHDRLQRRAPSPPRDHFSSSEFAILGASIIAIFTLPRESRHFTMQRELDIILLGATGYMGRLCAECIGNVLSSEVKWAIAGRSKDKLTALAESLDRDGNSDPHAGGLQRMVHELSLTDFQSRL